MKKACKRLLGRSGESIAEALIALLISSVGLMMLAGMLTSGARLITKSRKVVKEYYESGNILETRSGAPAGTLVLKLEKDGSSPSPAMDAETFETDFFENRTISGRPVFSYRAK